MQIKISTRHGHLAEGTQATIREKVEKLLHFFDRITMIEVTVDLGGDQKLVEILVGAEHKHDFVAHERNVDLPTALDLCIDKAVAQLRKYKEKLQDHRRDPQHNTPPSGT